MSYSFNSYSSSTEGSAQNNIAQDLLALLGSGGATGSTNAITGFSASSSSTLNASLNASASGAVLSQIELAILRSLNPIEINESEEITIHGQRGVWLNKAEINAWRGDLAISEYKIYEDSNPEIITKKVTQAVEYIQELAIRYLRPPTPPAPGEIVITMEANIATGPAPPLIIRQQPARALTPEPLVIREAPPQPPVPVGPKRITISGKRLPPPPRKVVIERLAPLPSKPQNVIIERWLPYGEVKRRVIFNKSTAADPVIANPRNVIVQWEAPEVNIKKEIKYLGVIRANPVEYVQRYGAELKLSSALPQFVLDIKTPAEVGVLAADFRAKSLFELEGQLEGFKFIDLDKEGLGEYRAYLAKLGIYDLGASASSQAGVSSSSASFSSSAITSTSAVSSSAVSSAAAQIFAMIDIDNSGSISIEEAEKIVLRLNSRLKRSYGESELNTFFSAVSGGSSQISKQQFLAAFEKLANF